MSFSFGKLFGGLVCGITLPYVVHDNVYLAFVTGFYGPHLKFHTDRKRLGQDRAIPLEMVDEYVKEIGKSFIFFWIIIGPTLY